MRVRVKVTARCPSLHAQCSSTGETGWTAGRTTQAERAQGGSGSGSGNDSGNDSQRRQSSTIMAASGITRRMGGGRGGGGGEEGEEEEEEEEEDNDKGEELCRLGPWREGSW